MDAAVRAARRVREVYDAGVLWCSRVESELDAADQSFVEPVAPNECPSATTARDAIVTLVTSATVGSAGTRRHEHTNRQRRIERLQSTAGRRMPTGTARYRRRGSRYAESKLARFGMTTFGSVLASMTSFCSMTPFSASRYAVTAYVSSGVNECGVTYGIARRT